MECCNFNKTESTKKRKSVCALPADKLHMLVAREEDDAAVRALPSSWKPRHGGTILANYLKQRELDHQTILQDLNKDAAKLNAEIDFQIRTLAESIRRHIQHNQTEIYCIVECCNASANPLTSETRNEALNNVNQLTLQRFEEVSKFKCEALALEETRGNRLHELLRDYFERLLAVGNETSNHLSHCFDERVYETNQQLLSNCQAYAELEARLRAQTNTDIVSARSSLNQLRLGLPFHKRISQQPVSTIYIRDSYSASDSGVRDSWVVSIRHILGGVEEFDHCVGLIVDTYKNALLKIFYGFSGKLINLREGLGRPERGEFSTDVFETSELRIVLEENLRRLSNSINSKETSSRSEMENTYRDVLNLQRTLGNLGWNLRKTYDILYDAGHLWDAHIMRSAFAQKLMMAAVEDLLTINDSLELGNEVLFGVALEQMRTSENPTKLEQCYIGLTELLNKTAEFYLSHSEEEIGRLEEFMSLPTTMAKTLLAEFNCFLERHPRDNPYVTIASNSMSMQTGTLTPHRDSIYFAQPLNRVILQSELRSLALQNWKNGFLESFQSNFSLVPNELDRQARSWVHEKKAMLNVRYSMKMMSHSIRLERIKAAKEMRLAELNHHDTRLASHLAAIFELIDSFTTETPNLLSIDEPSLYPFCDWIDMIRASLDGQERNQLDPKTRMLKSSYPPRLMKHRVLFEESLDDALDEYRRSVDQRLQAARIANFRFISALKLFGEGGSYSCNEASKTAATLVRAAGALEASVYKTYDGVIQRRSELLKKADGLMEPLMRLSRGLPEIVTMKGQELTKEAKKSLVKRSVVEESMRTARPVVVELEAVFEYLHKESPVRGRRPDSVSIICHLLGVYK